MIGLRRDEPENAPPVEYDYDDHDDDRDCYECGGEGYVWDCFDGFCVNAEDGCEDCTRPCPECARAKRERAEKRE